MGSRTKTQQCPSRHSHYVRSSGGIGIFTLLTGDQKYLLSRRLIHAFSPLLAESKADAYQAISASAAQILSRLFDGETVAIGNDAELLALATTLELRGFSRLSQVGSARQHMFLKLNPAFVKACFDTAIVKVGGEDAEVSRAGLALLFGNPTIDRVEFEGEDADELLRLLRLESVAEPKGNLPGKLGIGWALTARQPWVEKHTFAGLEPTVEVEEALHRNPATDELVEALKATSLFKADDFVGTLIPATSFVKMRPTRASTVGSAVLRLLEGKAELLAKLLGDLPAARSVGEAIFWVVLQGAGFGLERAQEVARDFKLAWPERLGWRPSALLKAVTEDDLESFTSTMFARASPDFNAKNRVTESGGDLLLSGNETEATLLTLAAQFGSVKIARALLTNEAVVDEAAVTAAFRGGNVELMRILLDRCPDTPVGALLNASLRAWNFSGLRWLLEHRVTTLDEDELKKLFIAACTAGAITGAGEVFDFSSRGAEMLRREAQRYGRVAAAILDGPEALTRPDQTVARALDPKEPGLLSIIDGLHLSGPDTPPMAFHSAPSR